MNKGIIFAAGSILGFIGGYHFATKGGKELLADVKEGLGSAVDKGQEFCCDGAKKVQDTVSHARPAINHGADQLQEKIEVARQIIADQVAKNAAEAKQAIKDGAVIASEALDVTKEKIAEKVGLGKDIEDALADASQVEKDFVPEESEGISEDIAGEVDEMLKDAEEKQNEAKEQIRSAIDDKF